MLSSLSDEELLARGDAEGLAALYERRYPLIRGYLRRRLGGHPDLVLDLVAETFTPCPPVGYIAPHPRTRISPAGIESPISVHAEPAHFYCEDREEVVPCNTRLARGYRRIEMRGGPPELLLVVDFTARVAVTNFDSHYEINTSDPYDPGNPTCPGPGAGNFGPTQTNLRAGQRVRYTEFVNPTCRGISHITIGFVTVDGPSGRHQYPGCRVKAQKYPSARPTSSYRETYRARVVATSR
jgi:hypothetical protein